MEDTVAGTLRRQCSQLVGLGSPVAGTLNTFDNGETRATVVAIEAAQPAYTMFTGDGEVADPVTANEGKTYTHEGATFRMHNCVGEHYGFYPTAGQDFPALNGCSPAVKVGSGGSAGNPPGIAMVFREAVSYTVTAERTKGSGGYAGQNECDNCVLKGTVPLEAPRAVPVEEPDEVLFVAEDADEVAIMVAALFASEHKLSASGGSYITKEFAPTLQAQNNGSTDVPAVLQSVTYTAPSIGAFVQTDVAGTLVRHNGAGSGETQNAAFVQAKMAVRRLTPVECERLMGFPPAEMRVSIGTWYDPESSDARVVLKSHKLRAGVWLAEGEGSRPSASCAEASLSTPRAEYAEPVVLNVLLQSDEWEVRTSRAGRCLLRVKSAELCALSRPLTQVESSAQTLALGVLALESAALLGREASHLLTMPSTVAESGNPCAVRFGDEMGGNAADAPTAHKNAKGMSTMSSPEPSASKVASMWTTLCCSAVRAIAGYTHTTTRSDSFEVEVVVHRGWTAIPWRNKPVSECPDGPRYKALGNSMAVNCMRFIGERIVFVDAVFSELEDASEADE